MSSKVKQANFRLPLEYMALIDEFARDESISKAAVIMRALDSLKASREAGSGAAPAAGAAATGASQSEINELRDRLSKAEARADEAISSRDSAEARARELSSELSAAQAKAQSAAAVSAVDTAANDAELSRLRMRISELEQTITQEKAKHDAEIAEKTKAIAERDARIASLSEQLGAANARAELAMKNISVEAVTLGDGEAADGENTRALAMLNMIGGVMSAFQQQVDDARIVGEQEGREAVRHELQDMVEKARNDGYRDAMGYLDDRVTTARESGAREERARIANMSMFERRRYLRMHIA